MGRAALFSFLLHLIILLLACFGLPWSSKPKIEPFLAIPVEMVTLGEETMAPKPNLKAPKEKPKPEDKPAEPKLEKPKPQPPAVQEESPQDIPEPEAKPNNMPLAESKSEPILEPVENIPAPTQKPKADKIDPEEPKIKPTPPKPIPPKKLSKKEIKDKKNKKPDTFDALLKNLDDLIEDSSDLSNTDQRESNTERQVGKIGDKLTVTEIDLLNSHFKKCWSVPAGAQDAENISVEVIVWSNPNGEIQNAEIKYKEKLIDPYYRTAAESALRALKDPRCSKLPLPPEKYESWKKLSMNFNPSHLLGG